jgi:phosphate starvation-inducible protein PhoH and related proteins
LPQLRGPASPTARGGAKTAAPDKNASRTEIHFDNNRLLADLLGQFDAHLSMLEQKLSVEAVAHGNVIVVKGSESGCAMARDVLEHLYSRLKSGHTIALGDVDGAIRHANAGIRHQKDKDKGEGPELGQLRTRKRLVSARTLMQTRYIEALQAQELIFATGPAGTGKTYLAVAHAAGRLERGETERLILSRPAVEAGERLGFLPGDLREKVDPYLRPLYDALYDVLPAEKVERDLESGVIEIAPLAFMRGRTLTHAMIILDEAQNCTSMQMKMFLTRLGEGSKMVVTGDPSQIDLPSGQVSGLREAIGILEGVKGIAHIPFTSADVVRHELVQRIVEAYDKAR